MAKTGWYPEDGDAVLDDGRTGKVVNAEEATYSGDDEWELDVEFEGEDDDDQRETCTLKYDAGASRWSNV